MKKLLAVEGIQLSPRDKRLIDHGAIYMADEFVPVDYGFNHDYIGKASNLQREGDHVYIDVELFDDYKDRINLDHYEARCSMTLEEYHSDTSRDLDLVVDKGRLRAVALLPPEHPGPAYVE